MLAQALLGGATVLTGLPGWIVASHLALGEALLACLILVAVVALYGPPDFQQGLPNHFRRYAFSDAGADFRDRGLSVNHIRVSCHRYRRNRSLLKLASVSIPVAPRWRTTPDSHVSSACDGHHRSHSHIHFVLSIPATVDRIANMVAVRNSRHFIRGTGRAGSRHSVIEFPSGV